MARKPLSSVDTAWLRMEEPTNPMMITGVMMFDAPLEYERLRATVERDLLCFDRFRQQAVQPLMGGPYWQDDADFDLGYHLQRATVPPPGDQAALQDLVSLLASRQLDFSRPLWQVHLVEEYGAGSALICRLHHCIADGLALVHVLLKLTDTEPDAPWPALEPEPRRRPRRHPVTRMLRPAGAALRAARQASGAVVHGCQTMRADPSRVKELARTGVRGTTSLAKVLLLWPDRKTILKGELGVAKRAAWSAPIPLQDVKDIGRALGATINDVLLTAMSGALRRYLQDQGQEVDGLSFRAFVPVNLRAPGTEEELGNRFGLVFLPLPVGTADPAERLPELKQEMDALKDSLEAPVAFGILATIGAVPEVIQDVVINIFGLKGTTVMTNVIGPKEPLYLAGAPLDSFMFWVPQAGRLGLGASILSYDGKIFVGVITDEGLVPDPDAIVAAFQIEFEELQTAVREAEAASPGAPDAGSDAEAGESADRSAEAPRRCQALTKAGKPCKNRALSGSEFCRVHQA